MHRSSPRWFAVGSKVELTIQWLFLGIPGQKYLLHALFFLKRRLNMKKQKNSLIYHILASPSDTLLSRLCWETAHVSLPCSLQSHI